MHISMIFIRFMDFINAVVLFYSTNCGIHTSRKYCDHTHFADALLMPLVFSGYTYIYIYIMRETTILISLAGFFLLGLGSVLCVMVVSFDFVSFLSRSPLAGALHAVVLARFNY